MVIVATAVLAGPMGTVRADGQSANASPPSEIKLAQQVPAIPSPAATPQTETDAQRAARLEKQVELQGKQIEVLEKMMKVVEQQVRQQTPTPGTEALQNQTELLKAASEQGALRDQELAGAVDDLREQFDTQLRQDPPLPAPLKELFLPSGTNETPLSIYGQFLTNYHQFNGSPGRFESADFSPYFLLTLNDRFLLAASLDISSSGDVELGEAQVNWLASDCATVVAGRYLTPIGFFNERLNHEWINKLPDPALMFRQVSPLIATNGLEIRGATYLGCSPIKMEYSLYGGNGFQLSEAPGSLNDIADLGTLTGGPDEVDAKAIGGRLGLWVPERGLTGGISAYFNGPYVPGSPDRYQLLQVDAGYRRGDWDVHFEYCQAFQEATSFIGENIRRHGLYAQVAYRPFEATNQYLQRTEIAYRYSMARFRGIDPANLDFTAFADSPVDAPVNREQHTVGLNYYFSPAMILKFAYEVNREVSGPDLHDNVFLAQFAWAF